MKTHKLISMTAFVLENINPENFGSSDIRKVLNYASFLKHPLKLEMFVPCDEEGEILNYNEILESVKEGTETWAIWETAKEKVLFEGFEVKYFDLRKKSYLIFNNDFVLDLTFKHKKYIESLIHLNIKLTPTAIKQIEE